MLTPNGPIPRFVADSSSRVPLRLHMGEHPGRDRVDGAWWPQSRHLDVELADLVDQFPAYLGRITRALFSPPDWDPAPRRIPVARGYVKVGSFPRDDTHLIQLTTSDRTVLLVLVVPPAFTASQGAEALLAASTPGNAHSAAAILEEVTDHAPVDPDDYCKDDGESWWGSNPVPPSFRTSR